MPPIASARPTRFARFRSPAAMVAAAFGLWSGSSALTSAVAISSGTSVSVAAPSVAAVPLAPLDAEGPVRCDPTKVVSSERCATCHAGEFRTWSKTPHALTFERLHQMPEAKAIAQRMGFSSIKRGGICLDCHYTVQAHGDKLKPISGVSCESCHGSASDWVTLHNDYGGPGATRDGESESHRQERIAGSIAAGMRNPRNLYRVAQSCLDCHTVRREELVNHGGHKPGSLDFELVAWSQGQVRHNFLRTDNTSNEPSSPERLRVMLVVGTIADLEYSTRATAEATTVATYGLTSAQRAADRALRLKGIQDEIRHPLVEQILLTFAEADLSTNNREQLVAIADRIRDLGLEFADSVDGSTLGVLDARLPAPASYR